MPTTDSLITGAINAVKREKNGSFKTRYNHIKGAIRFEKTLRELGYGVKKWCNITNKHVGAVVDRWKEEGLKAGTIKNYLSPVRIICKYHGNDRIHKDNKEFKIENRKNVTNKDKSLPQEVYEKVVKELKSNGDAHHQRVAAQLQLARELGLRVEESRKFSIIGLRQDGRVFISYGTKGGLDRFIHEPTEKGIDAIKYVKFLVGKSNLIPKNMSEAQWQKKYYSILKNYGITKKDAGSSSHGLRHAYAQERYESMTGFKPPCKFESKQAFRINAENLKGAVWHKLDKDARLILKSELGHGPERDDVVSQYLGAAK
ncbi:MAG: integrase domain-containing protein [Thermotogota bacterium]|nr:integrase domain-containing protein [Thermotogota bacterium]